MRPVVPMLQKRVREAQRKGVDIGVQFFDGGVDEARCVRPRRRYFSVR